MSRGYTTTLRKVGGSVMLAVPPVLLKRLDLKPGAPVNRFAREGRMLVEPRPRPRYTLDELLSQCDPSARVTAEERTWTSGPPAGAEIL